MINYPELSEDIVCKVIAKIGIRLYANEGMKMMEEQKKVNYDIELPQTIIDSFARFLVSEIRAYYAEQEENCEVEND